MNTEGAPARRERVAILSGPERSLGITPSKIVGDDVVTSMATGPWLNGPAGSPPGGVLGVLVDDILGFALVLGRGMRDGLWSVSAEISVDLTGPVPANGSRLVGRARNVHSGPHGGLASGTVHDADGNVIALCRQHGRWITTVPDDAMPPDNALLPVQAGDEAEAPWSPPASLTALLGVRVPLGEVGGEYGVPLGEVGGEYGVQPTEGGVALELDVTEGLTNPLGNLHGGITFAACDLAAQAALLAVGGPTQTASIHVAYPRPMPLGTTPRFEARVLHHGRSLGIVRVTATLDGVKPCSVATVTTGRPG